MRFLLFVCLLLPLTATAQTGATPSSYAFLRMEPSARAVALGGAYGAVADGDPNVVFYNAALPSAQAHHTASLSYLNYLAGIDAGFLSYARHLGGVGTLSGGLRFVSYGEFVEADAQGHQTGTFSAQDVALTVGLARAYDERWRYGANVSLIHSGLADATSQALTLDAGLALQWPEQGAVLSASVHHLGTVLSAYDTVKEDLPLDVRLSASKKLQYLPLLVSVTAYDLHDWDNRRDLKPVAEALAHLTLGGEFQFGEAFRARIGYSHRQHEELKTGSRIDLAGVRLGFGLAVRGFIVDYGYGSWSANGGAHQFTLRKSL